MSHQRCVSNIKCRQEQFVKSPSVFIKQKQKQFAVTVKKRIYQACIIRYTFNFHIFRDERVVNQATMNLSCTQFRFSIQLVNLRNRTLTASTTTSTTIPLAKYKHEIRPKKYLHCTFLGPGTKT